MFKISRKMTLCFFLILFCSNISVAAERQLITLYSYHLMPPYLVDTDLQQGFFYDFARYLNSRSAQFQFHVQYVPRKRVKRMLESDNLQGVLLGVSPTWFGDKAETKYLWTDKIVSDQDDVVSLIGRPLEYNGPESLKGTTIGGVLGFYYYGINELVAAGEVERVNTHTEHALLSMILSKRVNSGIISRAAFNYLVPRNQWQDKFHISKQPHDRFDRRLLVPKRLSEVHSHLQSILLKLNTDEDWLRILNRYTFTPELGE